MKPVRTAASNFVYLGPAPDIADAWVEREPDEHVVYLDWQASDGERAAIAGGALIRLGIFGMEPIPPVSLNVSGRTEITPAAAAWRDRAHQILAKVSPRGVPPGCWVVSADVWEGLQRDGALDPDIGVPTLYGRPVMVVGDEPDHMTYAEARSDRPPRPPAPPKDREQG